MFLIVVIAVFAFAHNVLTAPLKMVRNNFHLFISEVFKTLVVVLVHRKLVMLNHPFITYPFTISFHCALLPIDGARYGNMFVFVAIIFLALFIRVIGF